jgi:ABC-type dipeptide/oligopeptide/nickel transport system permease subunit
MKTRATLAFLWLAMITALSIAAPLVTSHDPIQPVATPLQMPESSLPLGADQLGRDLWSRLVYGSRATLSASILAAALSITAGLVLGLLAAFIGGWLERTLLLLFNATMAVPGLLLAMLFVAGMGPGLPSVILGAGLSAVPGFARLVRSQAVAVRSQPFIQAAEALGAGKLWIYIFHILPNLRSALLSYSTTYLAWTFASITTLNFLGLAGDPSIPEWGVLLNTGRGYLLEAPHLILLPGLLISFTILSFHSIGDWLSNPVPLLKLPAVIRRKEDQEETL